MFDRELAIIVADVDEPTRVFLADQLTADGVHVVAASSTEHARVRLRHEGVDLVVLGDLDPRPAAMALLRDVRAGQTALDPAVPVLRLSSEVDELAVLRAFDAGADDVLAKPFAYPVLRARLRALAARGGRRCVADRARVGSLEIDGAGREVTVAGTRVELSAKEFALLSHLAADPRRVFTKQELLREVWGFASLGTTRTLDSHACRLRRKLGAHGDRFIVNVWGVGYRLVDTPTVELGRAA